MLLTCVKIKKFETGATSLKSLNDDIAVYMTMIKLARIAFFDFPILYYDLILILIKQFSSGEHFFFIYVCLRK